MTKIGMTKTLSGGRVVIVGGGVIGISIAFHLAKRGYRDVVVLERDLIGEGATAAATGGIRQQFTSEVNALLVRDSLEFFTNFKQHTGHPLHFIQHGYLFLANSKRTMNSLRDAVSMQQAIGIDARAVDAQHLKSHYPFLRTDDLIGGAYCSTDGSASPVDATQGMAGYARHAGVQIRERAEVLEISRDSSGTVLGVKTANDFLPADSVVIAAGPWAKSVGRLAHVELPVSAHRRQAFAIEPLSWFDNNVPFIVDLGSGAYLHATVGGAVIGGNDRDVPEDTDTKVDWTLAESLMASLSWRIPETEDAGLIRGWAGLREMTPDDHGLVGPIASAPGLWAAVGFSGHGFMQAPAVGRYLAEWMMNGSSSVDLSRLDPARFSNAVAGGDDEGIVF